MPTTTHTRSMHIDAPVERVFEHVKDPDNFLAVMREADPDSPGQITKKSNGVGVGSTFEWWAACSSCTIHIVVTRTEYVPNERIVDHQPMGDVTWTHTTVSDETGTTLTLTCDVSSKVPMVDKVEDKPDLERRRGPRQVPGRVQEGDRGLRRPPSGMEYRIPR